MCFSSSLLLSEHKPLYIIMEFAQHGNLKNYLMSLRRILQAKTSYSSQGSYNHSLPSVSSTRPSIPSLSTPPVSPPSYGEREEEKVVCTCDPGGSGGVCSIPQHSYVNLGERGAKGDGGGADGKSVLWHHLGLEHKESDGYYNQSVIDKQRETTDPCSSVEKEKACESRQWNEEPPSCVVNPLVPFPHLDSPSTCCSADGVFSSELAGHLEMHIHSRGFRTREPISLTHSQSDASSGHHTLLSYKDILNYAIQIARGMEHLENMKVS